MCHLLSGSCQAGPLSCSLVLASHTAPITQNPNSSAAGGRLAHGRPPSRSLLLFSDGRCGASGQCGAGRAPIPQPAPSTPRSHHRLFPWKPRSDSGLWDQLETATQSGSRPGGARRAGSGARSPGRAPSGAEGDAGRGAGREALPAPALPQHPAGSAAAGSAERVPVAPRVREQRGSRHGRYDERRAGRGAPSPGSPRKRPRSLRPGTKSRSAAEQLSAGHPPPLPASPDFSPRRDALRTGCGAASHAGGSA